MKRRAFLAATAAPLLAAAVPRSIRAARSGGGVVALVTADLESHLVAVDADSGRVLKRISTAPGPRSVESSGFGQALVAHTAHGRLSLVDTARLEVVTEIGGLREPRYTAMHPAERLAYVSDSRRRASRSSTSRATSSSGRSPSPARRGTSPSARTAGCSGSRSAARRHGLRSSTPPTLAARSSAAPLPRRSSHTTSSGLRAASRCG